MNSDVGDAGKPPLQGVHGVWGLIVDDIRFYAGHSSGWRRWFFAVWTLLWTASLQAIVIHRLANCCTGNRLGRFVLEPLQWLQRLLSGCVLSPWAKIGARLRLPHPSGVVIGSGVIIGDGVTLYQGVTLGARGSREGGGGYPVLGDGVVVYTGACVLGQVCVGRHATIAANAVVLQDVPDFSVAIGVPAKVRLSHLGSTRCADN